jgi:predicted MFS family arabinose efflux permease
MSPVGWAAAFLMVASSMLIALIIFWFMRPRELTGDRGVALRVE